MARDHTRPAQAEKLAWVEQIASYFNDVDRMPLIAGRVIGWLMICDPPEQTAADIAEAIGASRASLSTNLRLLETIGLVSHSTRPAAPALYYRIEDGAWQATLDRQVATLTRLTQITEDGIRLAGPAGDAARIRAAHEVFTWMRRLFTGNPPQA